MASDAHSHPYDLSSVFSGAEAERKNLGIVCAASAWNKTDWTYNETLAENKNSPAVAMCFAVHPQAPSTTNESTITESLELLLHLASEKKLNAVGETGFDLFNDHYKQTEDIQKKLFERHLDIALEFNLPMVLHIRRAMDNVFFYSDKLKKISAVVFHSFSGSVEEAQAILKKGINAYFSFGTTILLNHKKAIAACAALPREHILFETDAPYQPLRGREYSRWADLPVIIKYAAELRGETVQELEAASDNNFLNVYNINHE
ncbi:TatD family hydrolase [Spirochaetia bacterium]|nr:TatD family hydrolase [Spirochaetia bacterium]